jgi:hypothetical protein
MLIAKTKKKGWLSWLNSHPFFFDLPTMANSAIG